jgi:hypothetical protein
MLAYASRAQARPKLRPASQSYLHRDNRAVIIGVIFTLAGILLTANVWLLRLLG